MNILGVVMERNQAPLPQHVIYTATKAALLDVVQVTLNAAGKVVLFSRMSLSEYKPNPGGR